MPRPSSFFKAPDGRYDHVRDPATTAIGIALILIVIAHVIGWVLAVIEGIGRKLGVIGKDEKWWIENP